MKQHISILSGTAALAAILALIPAADLRADDIVHYNFNTTGDAALALRDTATGITSTAITYNNLARNSTGTGDDRLVTFAPTEGHQGNADSSAATTLTAGTYFTFTITVDPGKTLSLDSFSIDAYANANGNRAFYVFSDKTGFTAADVLLAKSQTTGLSTTQSTFSIPLTSVTALQNLTAGQSVEFRIYVQTDNTTRTIVFDNVKLTGTVAPAAVPEPATTATWIAGAIIALAAMFRRSHR
ncbi:hypothetical protein [Geminisphaera colitermitum]|uniref:hypothetical protein n=1 Tax=Geminisphaera colitermitum TaxID=1148786 RepID=UPI0005BA9627|nr:hypothetical protein [Geminisphaera colitermitum]